MKILLYFIAILLLSSCYKGKKVDLIIHNGKVHVMNEGLKTEEAIAIQDGIIVEVGPERQIMNKYRADVVINAQNKDVYPGFHDSHGHIISLAKQLLNADLRGSRSYYEMISILEKHHAKSKTEIIIGRGWDQSLWGESDLPNDSLLNIAFPTIPVALTRIDGHAMLVNQALRNLIGITDSTTIEGGEIIKANGKTTGILLDNALDLVYKNLPKPKKEDVKQAILKVQDELLSVGITAVHEAGLDEESRDLFIELAEEDKLKIFVYAMLMPTEENIKFALEKGFYKNKNLSIRSFKIIADGALGSYGACLLKPYTDNPETSGLMLQTLPELQSIFNVAKQAGYQVNTHCIGDSANRLVLNIIDTLMKDELDHRFRIEHAQIISPEDISLFSATRTLPSVQPTHAVSDRRWAENRLGKNRLEKGAYAYKSLQKESGMILFGTDFPIENYNPFTTIFAATQRKDIENQPLNGFLPEEAVSLDVSLKAMTLWASYGCFEETEMGTIEKGKRASLAILDQPLDNFTKYLPNYSWITFMDGKIVYDMR